MNPRQRRGALLMILAAIGAVFVFISVVSYVSSVRAEVGALTTVLRLTQNVAANTPVTPNMLEPVDVPQKWTPNTMITNPAEANGQVAAADLAQGSYLQRGMLVPAPALAPGQREIAIMIDAETGVAGKVNEGDTVDIFATFEQAAGAQRVPCAARVIRAAKVIQVGQRTTERSAQNAADVRAVVPITFALSLQDTQNLTYVESHASKIRLALIGRGQQDSAAPINLKTLCRSPAGR
ncbi:MAG: Flp pilus assembly protein CpaB [Actinomadura sp.]